MLYTEYLKTANKEKTFSILNTKEISDILNTPFSKLNKKYLNLIPNPGELGGEFSQNYLIRDNHTLKDFIQERIDTQSLIDSASEYDDFENTFTEGAEDYLESYFIYKDDTKEPCGFISYSKYNASSKEIYAVVLFSFDLSRRDFGKQIWIDFEKDLKKKVQKGYVIKWRSKKENKACDSYDNLIAKFNGIKFSKGNYWDYQIGGNNKK